MEKNSNDFLGLDTNKTTFNDYSLANLSGLPDDFFKTNRENFLKSIKKLYLSYKQNSLILLEGGLEVPRHDTDTVFYHFIQESNFYYLTGVVEPNFYLVIDLKSEVFTLFMEVPNIRMKIFMHIPSLQDVEEKYKLECKDKNTLVDFIKSRNADFNYSLKGVNSDSGIEFKKFEFKGLEKVIENEELYNCLVESRVIKSEKEINLMEFISNKTVDAHIDVLKTLVPGVIERDVENAFVSILRNKYYYREYAYTPICGCGNNSSTLHYIKNDEILKDGDLMLLDMGLKLGGYCSDVTSTIPVNGVFTKKQKQIYDIVLLSNRTVIACIKPGVSWADMHLLSEKIIVSNLQTLGLLNKEYSVDEMIEKRIAYYFYPHGLGHLVGIDVHDVGGYSMFCPERSKEIGLRSLRTARKLEENVVITVEPGIYFIEFLLEKAFKNEEISKYFNIELIKSYYGFGGMGIEDVVLVTKDGCKNFCENLPRTTEEIETVMNRKK